MARNKISDLAYEAFELYKKNGGCTLGVEGSPEKGFAVGGVVPAEEYEAHSFARSNVEAFIAKHWSSLADGLYCGVWASGTKVVLDISKVSDTLPVALIDAGLAGEEAVFDLANKRTIWVG
jgi:hypothetical protein